MAQNINPEDIQKNKSTGLKGLPSVADKERIDNQNATLKILMGKPNKKATRIISQSYEEETPIGKRLMDASYGESKYDKAIVDISQLDNLNENRATQQSGIEQLAHGFGKMLTTVGTTLINDTVGALYGIGSGIATAVEGGSPAQVARAVWDNHVTNAMQAVSNWAERAMPNYRSEWEQTAAWYDKMFSAKGAANFWGDTILKNAGFTIGTALGLMGTSGVLSPLKSVSWLQKMGRATGLLKKASAVSEEAATLGKTVEATKFGKFTGWLANTWMSTNGEASLEALNAVNDLQNKLNTNVELRRQQRQEEIKQEYIANRNNGMDETTAGNIYNKQMATLDKDIEAYKTQANNEITNAGNIIYGVNVAVLALSNNLMLGSLIKGSYDLSKSLLANAIKQSTKTKGPISTVKEVGDAIKNDALRFSEKEIKHGKLKTAGLSALIATQEGLEEGAQSMVSDTSQIHAAAKMNKFARTKTSMLGSMVDPDAEEGLIDWTKAMGKAWQESFGTPESSGWEEVAAGFITGLLGTGNISVSKNEKGKLSVKPVWQGGISEAYEQIYGPNKRIAEVAQRMNKILDEQKFGARAKRAIRNAAIRQGLNDAVSTNDEDAFNSYSLQQLISDAIFFKDTDMLDAYLNIYKDMADGVTDDDINELKLALSDESGISKLLDDRPIDEIKEIYQNTAKEAYEKITSLLEQHRQLDEKYGSKLSEETRDAGIMELLFRQQHNTEMQKTLDSINTRLDELYNPTTYQEHLEKQELEQRKEKLEEAFADSEAKYKKYTDDLSTLQKDVEDSIAESRKIKLYRKVEKALEGYAKAESIKDILDVYQHSPEEERDEVLNKAYTEAKSPEVKAKIKVVKDFIEDVDALTYYIDKEEEGDIKDITSNKNKAKLLLSSIIDEIVSSEELNLDRANIKTIIDRKIEEIKELLEYQKPFADLVEIGDDGNIDVTKAIESGEASEKDIWEEIDVDTGEITKNIIPNSKLDNIVAEAFTYKHNENASNILSRLHEQLDKINDLRAAREAEEKAKEKARAESKKKSSEVDEEEAASRGRGSGRGRLNFTSQEEAEGHDNDSKKGTLVNKNATRTPEFRDEIKNHIASSRQVKDSKTGIVYNVYTSDKSDIAKAYNKAVTTKINEVLNKLEEAIDNSEIHDLLQQLLDIIDNEFITPKVANIISENLSNYQEFFKDLNKTLSAEQPQQPKKDDNEGSAPVSNNSMHGNHFYAYADNKNTREEKRLTRLSTSVIQWLDSKGPKYAIQEHIDRYLYSLIGEDLNKVSKDRHKIHYLHTTEQPDMVFLGLDIEDFNSVDDELKSELNQNSIEIGGKRYYLVGTLGYNNRTDTEGTNKTGFNAVLNALKSEHTENEWYVHPSLYTVIEGFGDRGIIKATDKFDTDQHNLAELLNSPESNPLRITLDDLGFVVMLGTEDTPIPKLINCNDKTVYATNALPGTVMFTYKDTKGNYIPVQLMPIYSTDIDYHKETPFTREIINQIGILVDPEADEDAKLKAIATLRDHLLFSNTNQIYYNDSSNADNPNTIVFKVNGIVDDSITVSLDGSMSENDAIQAVIDGINKVDPRINLKTAILTSNPKFYLDSGLLYTDVATMSSMGANFSVRTPNANGEIVVGEDKINAPTYKVIDQNSVKQGLYLEGIKYYYDGSTFTLENGTPITKQDEIELLNTVFDIQTHKNKDVINIAGSLYYDRNGVMFSDTGHDSYIVLSEDERQKILNKYERLKKAREAKAGEQDKVESEEDEKKTLAEIESYKNVVKFEPKEYISLKLFIQKNHGNIQEYLDNLEKEMYGGKAFTTTTDGLDINNIIKILVESHMISPEYLEYFSKERSSSIAVHVVQHIANRLNSEYAITTFDELFDFIKKINHQVPDESEIISRAFDEFRDYIRKRSDSKNIIDSINWNYLYKTIETLIKTSYNSYEVSTILKVIFEQANASEFWDNRDAVGLNAVEQLVKSHAQDAAKTPGTTKNEKAEPPAGSKSFTNGTGIDELTPAEQLGNNGESANFAQTLSANRVMARQLSSIIESKFGVKANTPAAIEKVLKEHNISTNISDINTILDELKNC